MSWIGKLVGGLLGMPAGPWGIALGAFLGHLYDVGAERGEAAERATGGFSSAARQQLFFEVSFEAMGHLAKADGRVSEGEIQAARQVMHQMRLRPEAVRAAIERFRAGKDRGYPLDARIGELYRACRGQRDLLRMFMDIQVGLVLVKGRISPRERELLWRIADGLAIGRVELAQIEALARARRNFSAGGQRAAVPADELDQAYRTLGVRRDASDRDVKTAYRRLMNEHHPDKQLARGLPESMLEVAKERTREIRDAWDVVRRHRNLR